MEKRSIAKNSKYRQIIGNQYGNLTVLDVFRDEKGQCRCKCQCGCGRESFPLYSNLQAGRTKSCGCGEEAFRRLHLELTGKRFGKLLVLEATELRKDGSVVWKCQCDCGNLYYQTARNLVRGFSTHCGCSRKKRDKVYYKDLTGQRFHRLSVLSMTSKRTNSGSIVWHCCCDCGNEVDVSESELVHGNRKSCGCRKEETGYELIQYRHFGDGTSLEALTRKKRSDNKSGYTGVYELPNGKYKAIINLKGKRYDLGTYESLSDAVSARKEGEAKLHQPLIDEWKKELKEKR
ncbi:hypothetical protein [Hespellia stercorisuis]|uniref:AP2 domain-containing protein n=1 Tax=Hespellia stercorisuis DSM 15480 TaxID=1121950 RepID=A0A1M6UMI2_9FIRM|nr:hypothetical protein [Hespellia stercorisuis]SHK70381.1 hypothetical protein SAMN02745243_03547 [Hespellia stercorisuis DSM 15480]